MSFGFSISDFLSVGSLALRLYASYRDGPRELREVSQELISLHTALEELRCDLENPNSIISRSDGQKTRNLRGLIAQCKGPLKELKEIYKKYEQKRMSPWRRVKLGTENIEAIRHKLGVHLSGIALFLTSISHESLGRMEQRLELLARLETKIDLLFAHLPTTRSENERTPTALEVVCRIDAPRINAPEPIHPDRDLELVSAALKEGCDISREAIVENIQFISALVTGLRIKSKGVQPASSSQIFPSQSSAACTSSASSASSTSHTFPIRHYVTSTTLDKKNGALEGRSAHNLQIYGHPVQHLAPRCLRYC